MTFEVTADMRRHLYGVAYRLLGAKHDAEDAVSEGVLRWQQLSDEKRELVKEPIAWLTRAVSRICLDHLKSARSRRERYHGIWLPEPALGDSGRSEGGATIDPADRVTLDDSVSFAFMVALERLSPAERVSFILHDVFDLPFAEIAAAVGRTPAACRQSAVSARKNLHLQQRYDVATGDRDQIVGAFLDACQGGDMVRLIQALDTEVAAVADGGGIVHAARTPIVGAEAVARYLMKAIQLQERNVAEEPTYTIEPVNGRSGIVVRAGGRVVAIVDVSIVDGVITRIHMQVNPKKLPS